MKKIIDKKGFFPIITTIVFGLFIYGSYSMYYEFESTSEGVSGILYVLIASIATGYFFTLLSNTVFKKKKWIPNLVSFLLGNAVYQGTLWITNAVINHDGTSSKDVLAHTYTVILPIVALTLLISMIIAAVKNKREFRVINVMLAVIYVFVCFGGALSFNADRINKNRAEKDIYFDPISAEELKISDVEKSICRNWFNEHFIDIDSVTDLPFDFTLGGESIKSNPDRWSVSSPIESDVGAFYNGGKTAYVTLRNIGASIYATIEATIYEDNATCEWTIYIKNTGSENSETISDFYALKDSFDTGRAKLYYSDGSSDQASDFILNEEKVSFIKKTFNSGDGRSTDKYLPYFNVSGETNGIVLGVGWTGLWEATIQKDDDKTDITVKQENFEAYLLPKEEIRSPLVSVSFYDGNNASKGFNVFRKWITDYVYPENLPSTLTMMEIAGPLSLATSDQILDTLNTFDDKVYSNIDNFWMDAGWYKYTNDWSDAVGSWEVDTARYDNGISELSAYAKEKGLGHVLWYEPERACQGTSLYEKGSQNEQWLITTDESFAMWNLADDDAFDYLCQLITASLKENGATVYRQDFNFSPDKFWAEADEKYYNGRTGICENHYVTNLYRYLDHLSENVEGLIIDNCASGGRRLDLEMTRRSYPAWRSDYNCAYHKDIIEATQSMTYGVSFWLPVTGTLAYCGTEYEARSSIMPGMLETFGTVTSDHFSAYNTQRALMTENYFPIENGGYSRDEIHAMQYSLYDGSAGVAFVYKRPEATEREFTVKLNGLNPESTYVIYDIDHGDDAATHTGKELMENGINIPLPTVEKGIILMFNEEPA